MIAYHGSAKRFSDFSNHFNSSGNGKNLYGWGMYFAPRREQAFGYATPYYGGNIYFINRKRVGFGGDKRLESLFNSFWQIFQGNETLYYSFEDHKGNVKLKIQEKCKDLKGYVGTITKNLASWQYPRIDKLKWPEYLRKLEAILGRFDRAGAIHVVPTTGFLYKVKLDIEPHEWFPMTGYWTRGGPPISKEAHNRFLQQIERENHRASKNQQIDIEKFREAKSGREMYEMLANMLSKDKDKGHDDYKRASLFLHRAGYKGLMAKQDSQCVVIDIKSIKKLKVWNLRRYFQDLVTSTREV